MATVIAKKRKAYPPRPASKRPACHYRDNKVAGRLPPTKLEMCNRKA